MKICFFAPVKNKAILDRNEFYSQDIQILKDLGHSVHIATNYWEITRADLYLCWWWTWSFPIVLLSNILNKPVICVGTFNYWKFHERNRLQQFLIEYCLIHSTQNIIVSELEVSEIKNNWPQLTNINYSPHIFDNESYSPNFESRSDFFLTISWLSKGSIYRKGIVNLIESYAFIPVHLKRKLLIVGQIDDGYYELKSLVSRNNLENFIQFTGEVSKAEKIRLLHQCYAYLQPSIFEGFGLAILEAMACGALVVVSKNGAIPEVVGDCGIYFPDIQPETIAGTLIKLDNEDLDFRSYGIKAHTRAKENFAYERRLSDFSFIIRKLR